MQSRRIIISSIDQSVVDFVLSNLLFCLSLLVTCILLIIIFALMFAGISPTWEKRCGRALLFSMVPVFVWTIYFFYPAFSPLLWTVKAWIFLILPIIVNKLVARIRENMMIARMNGWRCPNCKNINESLYIICRKCNTPKHSGT